MRRDGFTLVEIMLALAVLAVALTVLLGARTRTVKAIRDIERLAVAEGLAEQILAEKIALGDKTPGEQSGAVDGHPGYSYDILIREIEPPSPEPDEEKDADKEEAESASRLYEIRVTVSHKDLGPERACSLSTLAYDQPAQEKAKEQRR